MSANWIELKDFDYREILSHLSTELYPSIFGLEKCEKKKAPICYKKKCYALHFVYSGHGYIDTKTEHILVKPNTVFLLSPDCEFIYYPKQDDPWFYFWVEFNGVLSNKIVELAYLDNEHFYYEVEDFKRIHRIFGKSFTSINSISNDAARSLYFDSLLNRIFSILINQKGFIVEGENKSSAEINCNKICKYIEYNYANPDFTINDLAEEMFYSHSYLTRFFKKHTGISPKEYLTNIRMEKAKALLSTSSVTIAKISCAVGYKNQFYFSKEFKEKFNITPSKYISEKQQK